MSTDTESLVYIIFQFIRFLLNVLIFFGSLFFLFGGCLQHQYRRSKRQWCIFNICIGMVIFAIINSVFAMLPLAANYLTVLVIQDCTLQQFLEAVAQGQVAYAFLAAAVHRAGPQEWKNRSFLWLGLCIGFQWLCSYLLPLPHYLLSNPYTCLGVYPFQSQFFPLYSIIFLLLVPVCLHLSIYILSVIFKANRATNIQVYPAAHAEPNGIADEPMAKYLLLMGLLFGMVGYGPKSILAVIDLNLQRSIILYAVLGILPSLCLLANILLLYMIHDEIRKKITCRGGT